MKHALIAFSLLASSAVLAPAASGLIDARTRSVLQQRVGSAEAATRLGASGLGVVPVCHVFKSSFDGPLIGGAVLWQYRNAAPRLQGKPNKRQTRPNGSFQRKTRS